MSRMPRCLGCGYFLHGLPAQTFPECGRHFDLNNPATFSTIPPLVRWRYWLPGFALALGIGLILYIVLVETAGFGVAVTLVLPTCIRAVIGYGCRVGYFFKVLLALGVVFICLLGLYSMSLAGVFCGTVLVMIALVPILVGTLAGWILRQRLKGSQWDQRWHLPVLGILLVPGLWGAIEAVVWHPYANESLSTTVAISAPVAKVWDSLMFYEEVHHQPPFLLRFALPRPLYTQGSIQLVGDTRTCVYTHDHLVKRVTERKVDEKLAFDVIEQTHVMNHSVWSVLMDRVLRIRADAALRHTCRLFWMCRAWVWRRVGCLGLIGSRGSWRDRRRR